MKLRLFQVAKREAKNPNNPPYFSDKQQAKKYRDELGHDTHKVTYGPDHYRFKQ